MTGRMALALALGALAMVGCSKEVTVTWYNLGSYPMDVEMINAPVHIAEEPLGTASPAGGRIQRTLKVANDDLPEVYSWSAKGSGGDVNGSFQITKDSKRYLYIVLPSGENHWVKDKEDFQISDTRELNVDRVPIRQGELITE